MNKSDLVEIREYQPNDKNFIFSTFLRGLYYGDSWFTLIDKDVFMSNYHKILNVLLASPNTKVNVACLKEDKDIILGYSIYSKDNSILHYVFCKSAWRSIGICRLLVSPSTTTVTHMTKVGLGFLKKHPHIKFNPFALS